MVAINIILHLRHQSPLSDFRLSSIGKNRQYWDLLKEERDFKNRSQNLYWPLARAISTLNKRYNDSFRCTLSFSGSWIEAAQKYDPELFSFWCGVVAAPQIALACTPHHEGLSALISEAEFCEDLCKHRDLLKNIFKKDVRVAHNPGLIYSDHIGRLFAEANFSACILDGWDAIIPDTHASDRLFRHPGNSSFKLIPSAYSLTEDFNRYCSKPQKSPFEVSSARFVSWIRKLSRQTSDILSVFWDLNGPGGERPDTLIFVAETLAALCEESELKLTNVDEAIRLPARASLQAPALTSQALPAHDLTPWLGSRLQQDILEKLSNLAAIARNNPNSPATTDWRKLMASENFKALETKIHESDDNAQLGDQELSPYDLYLCLSNIIEDLNLRLSSETSHSAGKLDSSIHKKQSNFASAVHH
jgi:alpha-amylase